MHLLFTLFDAYWLSLQQQSGLWISHLVVLGLIAGSFSTMLIYRLPLMIAGRKGLTLSIPSSHCPQCQHPLSILANLPLVGYLAHRGLCRYCRRPIGVIYLGMELGCLIIALLCGYFWGISAATFSALFLFCALLTLAVIDLRTGYLPDALTLSLLWIGLLGNSFSLWVPLFDAVWGAAVGWGFLMLFNWGYYLLRRKDGLGGGDMKLFAALGAYFGWQALSPLLLFAAVSGCLLAACIWLVRRRLPVSLPWGPHLALAGVVYALSYSRLANFLPF